MPRFLWSSVGLTMLTTVTAGALAAPAQAASVGVASVVETTKVQFKAASGKQNRVVVTRSGNVITVDDRVAVKAGKGCKAVKGDKTRVRCTTKKAPTRIRIYTYDRNDSVTNKTDLGVTVDGGTGNDRITGGPRADILRGGRGADHIWGLAGHDDLDGGDGNDRLYGGDGNDEFLDGYGNDVTRGGNGDDRLFSSSGDDKYYGDAGNDWFDLNQPIKGSYPTDNDYVSGGAGTDTVHYWYHSAPVSVDLDGAVGDDGMKGEKDTVAADNENLVGGSAADRLAGGPGANSIEGAGGNDVIHGLGGDDWLSGDQGSDKVYGGDGDDFVSGDDSAGPTAADHLDGGANGVGGDRCKVLSRDTAVNCEARA